MAGSNKSINASKDFAVFSLDLADDQRAIEVANKIPARMGRAVTVCTADGRVVVTIAPATRK